MDLWSTIGEDDLFSRKVSSSQQTLNELVEHSLSSSPDSACCDLIKEIVGHIPADSVENVQVLECCHSAGRAGRLHLAPKILKKKTASRKTEKAGGHRNLKKVTFEVEKMVAREALSGAESEDARERLAISLGARPVKGDVLNYKQLKEQRAQIKVASSASLILIPNKKKPKKKFKTKSN